MAEEHSDNTKSGEGATRDLNPSDHTVIINAPRELGCYRLTRLLGRGGMGEVWQAFDTHLERDVAIKLMRQELLTNEDATRRFFREARAVARLNHPNIVQVYAFGDESGINYFVMEMVEGETVSQCLKRKGTIPLEDALHMMLQAIEGLSYANARGIIHRDIKPSNLMITDDNRLKIADFGLAKMVEHDTQMTAAGTAMGSPNYMSPEQARGEEADHRSDIYALGISLYQMLCGDLPFTAASPVSVLLKHIQEPLPEPEVIKCLGSGEVLSVLKKMTDKRPELRYQTYGELANALAILQPNLRVKGAHLATASMPAAINPTPTSGVAGSAIPPPPPPATEADSIFSKPTDTISATPSDQRTAVVSSRDTGSSPAVPSRPNNKFLLALAGVAALIIAGIIAWFFISRGEQPFSQAGGDSATIAANDTSNDLENQQATPATDSNQSAVDETPTPAPSPSPASPSPSASSVTATPRPHGMQPVDIAAIVTPRPTPMPGVATTITPVPKLNDLAPVFHNIVLGGPNQAAGSSVSLYDSAGNSVGTLAAGTVTALVRPATLNGEPWFVIRHNSGEAFVKAAEAHYAESAVTPQTAKGAAPTHGTPAPTIYVLGTAGAGPNESVPAYLDKNGRNLYKTFPAGTEVQVIESGVTMIRALSPDGRVVYIYKKMASLKH